MNNPQYETEREIRIRDLFITVCQRWRSLLVCFVIGAIVLGGYGWWKSGNQTELTPAQAQEIAASLDEDRKESIENDAKDIQNLTEQMSLQREYNKYAQIMKLDPLHLYVYELKYLISSETEEEGNKADNPVLGQAYISALQEDFLGKKLNAVIVDQTGLENKEFYESPTIIKIDKTELDAGILTILLYYQEPGKEEEVSQLKNAMQTAKSKVQNAVGNHAVKLIGESGFEYADMDIQYIQEANTQRINNLSDKIDKIKKAVTDSTELTYLDYLLSRSEEEPKESSQDVSEKTGRHISKKYILFGAILGVILAAFVIIIKYITSNAIKSSKELEEDLGMQVLGSFQGSTPFYQKRKTKLDQWLRNKKKNNRSKLSDAEMADLVATKIKIEAEKKDLHSICLAVDGNMTGDTGFLDLITSRLGEDPSVKVIRNILERSEELEGLSGMDGIVMVEQMEMSGYDDLKNTCMLCRNYQVNIIGCIAID